jgi:LPS export ABC transporter permease LptG
VKILHRYILSEISKMFLLILSGIVVFILISTMLDEMGVLLRHKPAWTVVYNYFLFKIPFLVAEAMPFALLLSILYVFSQLSRYNELIAIKSAGIDFNSVTLPVLVFAFFLSLASFALNETVISYTSEKANYIKENIIEKRTSGDGQSRYHLAKLGSGGRVFYIRYFDGLLGIMKDICILKLDRDFNLLERLDAKEGTWHKDKWVLTSGVTRAYKDNSEISATAFNSYDLIISDTPEAFVVKRRSPEETLTINIVTLSKHIKILKESGFKYQEELVNYHLKFAFPFASLILALLGVSIPFLFSTTRSLLNAALGFIATVVISFFYMGFVTIGLSLGKVSTVPPFFSAWLANIIFGAAGIYLLSKVKK